MMHELIIEGVRVGLPDDLAIEVIVENNLFDFSNINADSSVFFEVPASPELNRLTLHAHRLQSPSYLYKFSAVYIHEGNQYFDGHVIITAFTNNLYKMLFVTNGATTDLADNALRSVNWPLLDRNIFNDPENLNIEQFDRIDSGWCFPMCFGPKLYSTERQDINVSQIFNINHSVSLNYLTNTILVPWVYASYILEYYLSQKGYVLLGNFSKGDLGNRIVHPSNYLIDGNANIDGIVDADASETPFQTQWNEQTVVFNTEFIDNYNQYDNASGEFTIGLAGEYNVSVNNLHCEQRRDPNPLLGSETYQIRVSFLVMGVQQDVQTVNGVTSNGNSINNHFFGLGYSFTATADDVGKKVKVLVNFSASNTRVSMRIRSGKFRAAFNPASELTPTISVASWIPDLTFSDYLIALQKALPLFVRLKPNEKAFIIDFAPELMQKSASARDWTNYASEQYQAEVSQDGFSLNYNYPKSAIDKLIPIKELTFRGYTLNDDTAEVQTPIKANDYLYSPMLNRVYKAKAIDNFGTLKYLPYSDNIYAQIIGNAKNEIIPDLRPVAMKYESSYTIPELPFEGNSELFKEGGSQFELLIALYHGAQFGKPPANIAPGRYAYASPSNLSRNGGILFPISLHYQDDQYGLYTYWYKQFLVSLATALTVETNLLLPNSEIRQLDLSRKVVLDHVLYYVRRLAYRLGSNGISESTATLVKIDPLARVIALPQPVPQEFTCSLEVLENGQPADGDIAYGSTVTVNYQLSNFMESQGVNGTATITLYYIDSSGQSIALDQVAQDRFVEPMEVETMSVTFVVDEQNYPQLDNQYGGRIQITAAFTNRCSQSRTFDFQRPIPSFEGSWNYDSKYYDNDSLNYTYYFFGGFGIPNETLTSYVLTVQFKVNGQVINQWQFDQDHPYIFNPLSVNTDPAWDYNSQILPFFASIIADDPSNFSLFFRKTGFAVQNGFTNNGVTNNVAVYSFDVQMQSQNIISQVLSASAPTDFHEAEAAFCRVQINPANTMQIDAIPTTSGFPNTVGSGLSSCGMCHEGLVYNSFVKSLPFVCSTDFGPGIYSYDPQGTLLNPTPDWLFKYRVEGAGGVQARHSLAAREIAGGIESINGRFFLGFDWDRQELRLAGTQYTDQSSRYLIQSISGQLMRAGTLTDSNQSTGPFFTVVGGTTIFTENFDVTADRMFAKYNKLFAPIQPGLYTFYVTAQTDQVTLYHACQNLILQT